jgi:glucokinase
MAYAVSDLAKEHGISTDEIESVGIGIPGVSLKDGTVIVHNTYWFNVPLRDEFQKHLDIPVVIDNDASVAAVYEYHLGVLAGCRVGVLITLGTGVGGGVIINGKVFNGAHGLGTEIGHMAVVPGGLQCTCGNKGCLEAYTSVGALIRAGRRCVIDRPESMLHHITGGDYMKVTSEMIIESAKQGDYVALSIVDEYVQHLSMGMCTLINILDPDIIAIGGGLSGAGDFLLEKIIKASEGKGIFENQKYADIKLAKSGNDAGLIGAAMLAKS